MFPSCLSWYRLPICGGLVAEGAARSAVRSLTHMAMLELFTRIPSSQSLVVKWR